MTTIPSRIRISSRCMFGISVLQILVRNPYSTASAIELSVLYEKFVCRIRCIRWIDIVIMWISFDHIWNMSWVVDWIFAFVKPHDTILQSLFWAYRSDRLGPIAPSIFTQPCNLSFMARFADINVSHDSVATYARCGGILNIHLTTNLLENLPVNFLKIG